MLQLLVETFDGVTQGPAVSERHRSRRTNRKILEPLAASFSLRLRARGALAMVVFSLRFRVKCCQCFVHLVVLQSIFKPTPLRRLLSILRRDRMRANCIRLPLGHLLGHFPFSATDRCNKHAPLARHGVELDQSPSRSARDTSQIASGI